jgi:hypothetical protein
MGLAGIDPGAVRNIIKNTQYAMYKPLQEIVVTGVIKKASNVTRGLAYLRAAGAIGEMAVGATFGVLTSWTGLGAVLGAAAVVHGADEFSAAMMEIVTGETTQSFAEKGIQGGLEIAGVSRENAAMIAPYANAGVGIALTGGAGAAKASITIAKTSSTVSEVSEPVIVNIPKLLTIGKIDKHHVLPQQFLPWFIKRGIPNIDDYCIQLSKKTHLKGVHGNGNGAQMPGKWNQLWEDFIKQNPNATPSEIFYHAESLLKRFGLEHLPFVKY